MRKRHPQRVTIQYFATGRDGSEIGFIVEGVREPYVPARFGSPAEGGEMEIVEVRLLATDEVVEMPFDSDEQAIVVRLLESQAERDTADACVDRFAV